MNKESVSEYVPSTLREVKLRDVPKAIVGTFARFVRNIVMTFFHSFQVGVERQRNTEYAEASVGIK